MSQISFRVDWRVQSNTFTKKKCHSEEEMSPEHSLVCNMMTKKNSGFNQSTQNWHMNSIFQLLSRSKDNKADYTALLECKQSTLFFVSRSENKFNGHWNKKTAMQTLIYSSARLTPQLNSEHNRVCMSFTLIECFKEYYLLNWSYNRRE